ncbi:DUF6526 family protein [Fictibacillus terranigra]|uniref:DUF6526 family protein n=1 Tax=Fictibacillus terranigra TaxID=3058424 RepID=A0ABT8EB20_9BACL|nr:DUF6526 family protein [Fictibacillus sp. CENA-BCM004]MDN4075119.1 DUF6526 family protein [Fictibacillus sp. CENA-BCM004]
MENQNFKNHTRVDPLFHYVLTLFVLGTLVTSLVYFFREWSDGGSVLLACVLFLAAGSILILYVLVRMYALKAQDRAIRAEENLRHFVLTGKLMDSRLSTGQIVALRFAGNKEMPALSQRAAEEGMNSKEIKQSINDWRGDYYRI